VSKTAAFCWQDHLQDVQIQCMVDFDGCMTAAVCKTG
jgi:hypothetical protein